MSGNESGACELKHCGKIHRASNFSELISWVLEGRVSKEDSFRVAGSKRWLSIISEPRFMSILDPSKQWTVRMNSGEYKTHQFEAIVKWAEEGRITEDAVVEGPQTPPGGVKASALPALTTNLRKQQSNIPVLPVLRIDGREYPAPDTDTVGKWIRDSRVPVGAEISLEGKDWELISSCGLFDLEDWPAAAHGRIEEESLPEMPEYTPRITLSEVSLETEDETSTSTLEEESSKDQPIEKTEESADVVAYSVVSGDSEMTIESVSKLRSLLKKRMIYSYDEIKHPTITEESISVGEYLESLRSQRKSPLFWILCSLAALIVSAFALEYFAVLDFVTWL